MNYLRKWRNIDDSRKQSPAKLGNFYGLINHTCTCLCQFKMAVSYATSDIQIYGNNHIEWLSTCHNVNGNTIMYWKMISVGTK